MKKVWVLCAVLVAGCALSETEQKVEAKVRFDKVYPVELAHYEYEERLQTFYDAEEISPSQLGKLYRGEFPNGETAPNKLRIHWTNARALAQAEVELQKDILGWAGADVSPRPILVNDRDDKFYRYYEYRVLQNGKEVGAVRIPAYRRTENFATAEVHQYNGGGSQYTVKHSAIMDILKSQLIFSNQTKIYQTLDNFVMDIFSYQVSQGLLTNFDQKIQKIAEDRAIQKYKNTSDVTNAVYEGILYTLNKWHIAETYGVADHFYRSFDFSNEEQSLSKMDKLLSALKKSYANTYKAEMLLTLTNLWVERITKEVIQNYEMVLRTLFTSAAEDGYHSDSARVIRVFSSLYWDLLEDSIKNSNLSSAFNKMALPSLTILVRENMVDPLNGKEDATFNYFAVYRSALFNEQKGEVRTSLSTGAMSRIGPLDVAIGVAVGILTHEVINQIWEPGKGMVNDFFNDVCNDLERSAQERQNIMDYGTKEQISELLQQEGLVDKSEADAVAESIVSSRENRPTPEDEE